MTSFQFWYYQEIMELLSGMDLIYKYCNSFLIADVFHSVCSVL